MSAQPNPDEYNGWANHETWSCHLWLSNDEGLYTEARERSRTAFDEPVLVETDDPAWEKSQRVVQAADALKSWVEDELFDFDMLKASEELRMMRDECGSLWRIDWQEIASAFLED